MGPRWWMSQLPLNSEPQYLLIVTHQLNDISIGAMTVPRLTIKDQKVSGSPTSGNLHPFPKIV